MEPGPEQRQAGTVMMEGGQWAYRYTEGAEPILMKVPERPAPAPEYSSEARTEPLGSQVRRDTAAEEVRWNSRSERAETEPTDVSRSGVSERHTCSS